MSSLDLTELSLALEEPTSPPSRQPSPEPEITPCRSSLPPLQRKNRGREKRKVDVPLRRILTANSYARAVREIEEEMVYEGEEEDEEEAIWREAKEKVDEKQRVEEEGVRRERRQERIRNVGRFMLEVEVMKGAERRRERRFEALRLLDD